MTNFKLNKKNITLIITVVLIISSYFLDGNKPEQAQIPISTSSQELFEQASSSAEFSLLDQNEPSSTAPLIINEESNDLYTVTKVIDGDTFEVERNGLKEKVRLIGINTPETVDPRRKVECFGKEASDYAKKLLNGQTLRLESDTSQDQRDKYGRLLVYAYLANDTLFNLQMIKTGYAYEYTYKTPYLYQQEFKAAAAKAKAEQTGLWSPTTCAGKK